MTNLYPAGDITQTAANGVGEPGAAPVGAGAMQGNPQASQYTPFGAHVPGPQNSSAQALHHQIAVGAMPLHTHPNNIAAPPGVDSLMAQLSRGQVMLNQSTYGQGHLLPANAGFALTVPVANVVNQPTGQASAVTINNPPIYTGN